MFNNKKNMIDALNECLKERRDTIIRQKEQLAELQAKNDALQDDNARLRKEIEEVKYTWGAENEELAKKLAEAEKRLKDAEEQNSKKQEPTETVRPGNRCEEIDLTGCSAKDVDGVHLQRALRILDDGGFVPKDKSGRVWDKAYILCLITEKGSQTYAAGNAEEYRTMFDGLFAAAKQNKEMDKALMLVQVLDMLRRKLTGAGKPEEAGDGNA